MAAEPRGAPALRRGKAVPLRPLPGAARQQAAVPAAPLAARDHAATAAALLQELRPRQWTKNLMVLAPLVFSHSLTDPVAVAHVVAATVVFCVLGGAVYLVNDVADRRADRLHPVKRRRPVAAGLVSPRLALGTAAVLVAGGLAAAAGLGGAVLLAAAAYLALQIAYSTSLKHLVILDVMAVATGFVLRVVAGAAAIAVPPSPWLLLCTALLALFLALAKRRQELLDTRIHEAHRPALQAYSVELLDQMIATVTAAAIVAYSVYTFLSREAAEAPALMLTIPFVVYGLFRYLYLIHQRQQGASPDEVLLTDLPLLIDLALWAAVSAAVIYLT